MELHELTDKEIKAIGDAVSTIKKFSKYIKEVNLDNYWLRKNLDESIKAGWRDECAKGCVAMP